MQRFARLLIVKALCCAAALAGAGPTMARNEFVETPFGKVPKECHRQHPAGTTLSQIPNGVRARHADGTVKDYISSEKCLAFGKSFKARQARAGSTPIPNGWFNYAGWTAPQNVGQFTANYTLPQLPTNQGPQTLYYFIGIQDIDSTPSAILQPVVGYIQGAPGGYNLSSWNCCPSGQANQGNIVVGMGPGDTITASIIQTNQSPSTYAINGSWGSNQASLNVEVGSEAFNWPNVTFEVANVGSCQQFLSGPFTFTNLYLAGVNGQTLMPTWGIEPSGGATTCNGQLTVNDTTITIEQNLTSSQRGR